MSLQQFHAGPDAIRFNYSPNIHAPGDISWGGWIMMPILNGFGDIPFVVFSTVIGDDAIAWEIVITSEPGFVINGALAHSGLDLVAGVWAHTFFTIKSGVAGGSDQWINGVIDPTSNGYTLGPISWDNTNPLDTGTGVDEVTNNCIMADWRIYNRALSAKEIQEIYRCKGADRIINGLLFRGKYLDGAAGVVVAGAGAIKDDSPSLLVGTPTNSPLFALHPIKSKRRYQ